MGKHKNAGNLGNCQNTDSFFAQYGQLWTKKKVQKRSFFPTPCFDTFPGICRRFRPKVLSQKTKTTVWARGPIPKVLIMRWKRSQPAKHPVYLAENLLRPHPVPEWVALKLASLPPSVLFRAECSLTAFPSHVHTPGWVAQIFGLTIHRGHVQNNKFSMHWRT